MKTLATTVFTVLGLFYTCLSHATILSFDPMSSGAVALKTWFIPIGFPPATDRIYTGDQTHEFGADFDSVFYRDVSACNGGVFSCNPIPSPFFINSEDMVRGYWVFDLSPFSNTALSAQLQLTGVTGYSVLGAPDPGIRLNGLHAPFAHTLGSGSTASHMDFVYGDIGGGPLYAVLDDISDQPNNYLIDLSAQAIEDINNAGGLFTIGMSLGFETNFRDNVSFESASLLLDDGIPANAVPLPSSTPLAILGLIALWLRRGRWRQN